MKKIISIITLVALLVMLTACKKSDIPDALSIKSESSALTKAESEIADDKNSASVSENISEDNSSLIESKLESSAENEIQESPFTSYDNIGDLDKEIAIKIKEDYIKSNTGFEKYKTSEIVIWHYYGSFSDGSISVAISPSDTEFIDILINEPIAEYTFTASSPQYYAQIYKNSKFYGFKEAYDEGIISKQTVDEFFERYSRA